MKCRLYYSDILLNFYPIVNGLSDIDYINPGTPFIDIDADGNRSVMIGYESSFSYLGLNPTNLGRMSFSITIPALFFNNNNDVNIINEIDKFYQSNFKGFTFWYKNNQGAIVTDHNYFGTRYCPQGKVWMVQAEQFAVVNDNWAGDPYRKITLDLLSDRVYRKGELV